MRRKNNFLEILKKIFGSENKTFRGSHLPNGFFSYVKGYDELKKASHDAMGVYLEVDGIRNALYPPIKVYGRKPGYYSFSDDYFEFDLADSQLKVDLTEHFLEKNYSDKIYGGSYDLGAFFQSLCGELLINGVTYYAVTWDKVKINETEYTLPVDFNYLHPATVSISGDKNKDFIIKQRYPFWNIIMDHFDGVFNRNIKSQDALCLKYPFDPRSPVQTSLKFIPAIKNFSQFGLDQGEASLSSKNHSLHIELARFKTYAEEKKKLDYARIKIRRAFTYLYDDQKLTSYYDVFTVVRYKKFLNDMRDNLLNEFNKQMMSQVIVRNSLTVKPYIKLKEDLFATNQKIETVFDKFKKKEITVNNFSKLINDKLDKTQAE